jgi:hypothetical protein
MACGKVDWLVSENRLALVIRLNFCYFPALTNSKFGDDNGMARFTQTLQDQLHLSDVSRQMPIGGIVSITLLDGRVVEGVMRRESIGNNGGQGGWQYHGECEIETKSRDRLVIDFLDVKSATNAWNESTATEYENLGLISIRR